MRAARSLSTRIAALGSAVAIATVGLVGASAVVATAGPAGALSGHSVPLGNTTCNLSTGPTTIAASISASITPASVNAGNDYTVNGPGPGNAMELDSSLTADATTSKAAGLTLTVSFAANMSATNAAPASQTVTFSGSVTLPNPFPVGASTPIKLYGNVPTFTAASDGSTSTAVSLNPSGQLTATLGAVNITGSCTGGAAVQIATAAIVPAAGTISNVLPNAGDANGGNTVKLVGRNFGGVSAVDFVVHDDPQNNPSHTTTVAATNVQLLSPTVITCTAPAVPGFAAGSNLAQYPADIVVTTAAGPSKIQPNDAYTFVDLTQGAIVSSVTPNTGVAAGGNTVTIQGAGFEPVPSDPTQNAWAVNFGSTVIPQANINVISDSTLTVTVPPGTGIVNVTVVGQDESTPSPVSSASRYNYNPGYMLGASDGGIFSFGQIAGHAGFFGSAGNIHLNKPIVGMAATPDGGGYWLVASDGGVFAYGDATFYGSAGNIQLNKPVVGIAATPDGAGYWLVASDGGIFSYGDALFRGSAGGAPIAKPMVGIAATSDGGGYWLAAADGGVFAYGDAAFDGSAGGLPLAAPVVGISASVQGGYWLVGADGGVFAYGAAKFHGSLNGQALASPISGIAGTANGGGYWLVARAGSVFNQGNAGFYGDVAGVNLNGPIVAFAPIQGMTPPS
jgi:hypothetical protein